MVNKRKALFTFLTLTLIFLSILAIKYYPSEKSEVTVEDTSSKKLTRLEIAKKVLTCSDKNLRDQTGGYITFQRCTSPASCTAGPFDGRVELYALWARGKYLESKEDPEEREIFDQDLDYYLDYLNRGVIMPDFWGRNLLYEIWQGKNISAEEKEKIEKLALNIDMGEGSHDLVEVSKLLKQESFQPQPLSKILASSFTKNFKNEDLTRVNFNVGLGYALDFLDYYRWKGAEEALKTSQELFNMAVKRYLSSKEVSAENICVLGLTAASFYERLNEKDYLDFSLKVFEDLAGQEKCLFEKDCQSSLTTEVLCAFYFDKLNQTVGEPDYSQMKNNLLEKIIEKKFDFPGYSAAFAEKGCFMESSNTGLFNLMNNSLLVGLLSKNEE